MALMEYRVDDLDESEGAETIEFGLDGKIYEVDLGEKNQAKLRKALEPFIGAARQKRTNGSAPKPKKKAPPISRVDQMSAIRTWANKNGKKVSDRGRIPRDVVDAFNNAHSDMPAFSG